MLSLSPAAGRDRGSLLPPPPAYLKLPQGQITHAQRSEQNPFAGKRAHRSPAQKAGLAYQRKLDVYLRTLLGASAVDSGPWYYYLDAGGRRNYCQPDFLLKHEFETLVVVEAKLRWTADAWWQLRRIYLPVLAAAHPGVRLLSLCVCRSYDPAIQIEEPVNLVDSLLEAVPALFNVCIMKEF